jgi:CDP-diacylglycerol--glycerol-3-phosphate 3-phosphatidyltransferase
MGRRAPRSAAGNTDAVLTRLRRRCRVLWIAVLGLIFSGAVLLAPLWSWPEAARWAAQACAVWAWVFIRLETLLDLNRHPTVNRLRPSLGVANMMTVGRAALVAALAGFLFQNVFSHALVWLTWIPGGLYLIAALMDAGDGWVARATGSETRLGEALDTEIDAMGILIASLLLVSAGKTPIVFVSVGLGYYAVRAAIRLRSWMGHTIVRIQPRPGARWLAGCQMGFAAAALLPVFSPNATFPAAYVMTAPFLAGMATDWLIICGRAAPDGRPQQPRLVAWQAAASRALPLFLRPFVAIGTVLFISRPCPAGEPSFMLIILILGLLCALGVAARLAAMILSVILAGLMSAGRGDAGATIVLMSALSLMMTGAGHPRIWQPEDKFFFNERP